jgi:hypothetical protein
MLKNFNAMVVFSFYNKYKEGNKHFFKYKHE